MKNSPVAVPGAPMGVADAVASKPPWPAFSNGFTPSSSGLALSPSGNEVYVMGFSNYSLSPVDDYDALTIKYDSQGNMLWYRQY